MATANAITTSVHTALPAQTVIRCTAGLLTTLSLKNHQNVRTANIRFITVTVIITAISSAFMGFARIAGRRHAVILLSGKSLAMIE